MRLFSSGEWVSPLRNAAIYIVAILNNAGHKGVLCKISRIPFLNRKYYTHLLRRRMQFRPTMPLRLIDRLELRSDGISVGIAGEKVEEKWKKIAGIGCNV